MKNSFSSSIAPKNKIDILSKQNHSYYSYINNGNNDEIDKRFIKLLPPEQHLTIDKYEEIDSTKIIDSFIILNQIGIYCPVDKKAYNKK